MRDRTSVFLQLAVTLLLVVAIGCTQLSVHLLDDKVAELKTETFRQANEIEALRAALRIVVQGGGP